MWQRLSDSLGWIRPVSYEHVWQLRHPCCPVSPPSRWPVTLLAAARPWLIPDQQREEKSTGVRFAPAGSAALPSSQNKSDGRGVSLFWEFIYEEAVVILNDLQKERKNQNKMCVWWLLTGPSQKKRPHSLQCKSMGFFRPFHFVWQKKLRCWPINYDI